MINEEIKTRQQYIRTSNELQKGPNKDLFVQSTKQKIELDRKLEELSINSGMSFSGNVVRQNILSSSVSHATTLNNTLDYDDEIEEDEDAKSTRLLRNSVNHGKETIQSMKSGKNNTDFNSIRFNNINRNI